MYNSRSKTVGPARRSPLIQGLLKKSVRIIKPSFALGKPRAMEGEVGVAGFEPATSCSQSRRDNRATLHPDAAFAATFKFQDPKDHSERNYIRTFSGGRVRRSCVITQRRRRDWDSNPGDTYASTD